MNIPRRAIVLLGTTSSGKSPLGELLQDHATSSRGRYMHFDFGCHLRRIASGTIEAGFNENDLALIHTFLHGKLLGDDTFYIARRILTLFLNTVRFDASVDRLILNGLPRHCGQARDLAAFPISVECVVYLDCPDKIAWERKALAENGAGFEDRSTRSDTAPQTFLKKLESFRSETLPLIDWYESRYIPVIRIPVETDSSPSDMQQIIQPYL